MTDTIEKFTIVDKVERGYTKIPNAVLQDPNLTDSAKLVLFFLLSISQGFQPTIRKIAKTLNMTEKKVQRAIAVLKSSGYISVVRIKDGSLYGGMQWRISNFPGTFTGGSKQAHMDKNDHIYMDKIDPICVDKNDVVENVQICADKINSIGMDKNDVVENDVVDGVHISEQPIGQQLTSEQTNFVNDQSNQLLPLQPTGDEDEEGSSQGVQGKSFGSGSSGAKAPSLGDKNRGAGEQVISQTEYLFRQLREKYPPHRLGDYAIGLKAFQSIPDINMVYPEIIQGLENWKQSESWSNEDGRYVPGLAKFLNERKWKTPPIWNNNAGGTNDYANSDTRKAVAQKWHQLETRNNLTIGEGE